uniref:Uncharacterized protein n=1 Tax=Chenopodium quinoa TaxID=63459 RepID=A0A803N1X5_CHEQI
MQGVQHQVRLELTTAGNTSPLAIDVSESAEPSILLHVPRHEESPPHDWVHPTVIELDEVEIAAIPPNTGEDSGEAPALFIGGTRVGGLESLVALHLSNKLVPLLVDAGALSLSVPLWIELFEIRSGLTTYSLEWIGGHKTSKLMVNSEFVVCMLVDLLH